MSNTFLNSFCVGIANKISIIWFFIFFSQSSKLYILFVVKTFVQSFSDIYVPKCCVDSSFNSRVILKVRLSSIYLFGFIGMSHWHLRVLEGAEFWISYKQTAFLSYLTTILQSLSTYSKFSALCCLAHFHINFEFWYLDLIKFKPYPHHVSYLLQASLQGFLYKNIDQISSWKPNKTPLV